VNSPQDYELLTIAGADLARAAARSRSAAGESELCTEIAARDLVIRCKSDPVRIVDHRLSLEKRRMRTKKGAIVLAFAATVVLSGTAQAAPTAGAKSIAVSAWTINAIMHAACRGRGLHCPHHFFWNGHRCRPC
jgi:hypothetical protein